MNAHLLGEVTDLKRIFDQRNIQSATAKKDSSLTTQERGLAGQAERDFDRLWQTIRDAPQLCAQDQDATVKNQLTQVKTLCDQFAKQYERRKVPIKAKEFQSYAERVSHILENDF